jgi:hypothetical protein
VKADDALSTEMRVLIREELTRRSVIEALVAGAAREAKVELPEDQLRLLTVILRKVVDGEFQRVGACRLRRSR